VPRQTGIAYSKCPYCFGRDSFGVYHPPESAQHILGADAWLFHCYLCHRRGALDKGVTGADH
jgi:hypothetical protein